MTTITIDDIQLAYDDVGAGHLDLCEQIGAVYAPTYSVVLTFLVLALVLAFRPQGLLGARS